MNLPTLLNANLYWGNHGKERISRINPRAADKNKLKGLDAWHTSNTAYTCGTHNPAVRLDLNYRNRTGFTEAWPGTLDHTRLTTKLAPAPPSPCCCIYGSMHVSQQSQRPPALWIAGSDEKQLQQFAGGYTVTRKKYRVGGHGNTARTNYRTCVILLPALLQ